ncbi:MAG: hypothetical protein AAFZ92_10100, partial [Pseudomonadota bacterium]
NSPAELNGSWLSTCELLDADFPDGGYWTQLAVIDNGFISLVDQFFEDANCISPLPVTTTIEGFYSTGGDIVVSGMQATEIDLVATDLFGLSINFIEYDVISVDGNQLFLGLPTNERDGSSSSQRFNILDLDNPYTRQ